MSIEKIKNKVRSVHDFPQKGIVFRDLTTVFKDPECLHELSILGIESRGFIMGPILANNLGAGFIPMRKPGKLPADTWSESYDKEYGKDTIEIHKDALDSNDIIVLHDDLLATGGTMLAAYNLVKRFNPQKIYVNFIIELEFLKGRNVFPSEIEIEALIKY